MIFTEIEFLFGMLAVATLLVFPISKGSAQDFSKASTVIGDNSMSDSTNNFSKPSVPNSQANLSCTFESSGCGLPKDDEELRKVLSPEQYRIVRENGTERPFQNAYWDNKKQGIYVDVVSGEVLFSSHDKFDSGTGWPSFTKPLNESAVVEKTDLAHGMKRVEVRSKKADSHLGHVFNDGPRPTNLRYCINSASLKFIEKSELKQSGYAEYEKFFAVK